jgi:hypothetical protein
MAGWQVELNLPLKDLSQDSVSSARSVRDNTSVSVRDRENSHSVRH